MRTSATCYDEHWIGRFKYVPLADDAWLTTGIELRVRDEGHHGNGSERLVGTARFVGAQAEGVVSWQATAQLALSASFSAFHPGGFIRRTGPVRRITLLGTEANFRF